MSNPRNNAAKTRKAMPVGVPFKAGNPGRPKGSRNRLGEHFLQAIYEDWQAHGADVLKKVREDRPHDYLKVVASLLPKQLDVQATDDYEHLSEEELRELLIQKVRELDLDDPSPTEH